MWHSRPPPDPPPFIANAILNFHFDYPHTSLICNDFHSNHDFGIPALPWEEDYQRKPQCLESFCQSTFVKNRNECLPIQIFERKRQYGDNSPIEEDHLERHRSPSPLWSPEPSEYIHQKWSSREDTREWIRAKRLNMSSDCAWLNLGPVLKGCC